MTDREAMLKAFEIIGVLKPENTEHKHLQGAAWDALRQALAQPEQEPVAFIEQLTGKPKLIGGYVVRTDADIPLYMTPSKREWVGLTEDEFNDCLVDGDPCEALAEPEAWEVMRSVEAKLKEKNT